jgi:Zn-dependent peptidase ImmA (M78 family)
LAIRRVQARQESLRELAEYDPAITQSQLPKYSQAGNPVDAGERERGRLGPSVTEQLRMSADKFWVYLRLAVEAQGVSVYLEDFPVEDCRGVSLFVDGFPAILLSANERRASWKSFSLMHEFAHILIREPGISDQNATTRSPVERYCNQFAAAFLLPKNAIESMLTVSREARSFDLAELEEAADRLNVSISTLALRLEELGYDLAGLYAQIRSMLKTNSAQRKPKQYLVLNRLGHRYTSDVLGSLERGILTRLDASRMLNTNPGMLPQLRNTISTRATTYQHGGEK